MTITPTVSANTAQRNELEPSISAIPNGLPPSRGTAAHQPNERGGGAPTGTVPARTIQRSLRDEHICVITFDRPNSSANVFDRRTLMELDEELELITRSPHVRGVILTSTKPAVFIAGADLKSISEESGPAAVRELIELGQSVMNRLASLPIPTVAAVHGAALGGGYELCLACDYRVASSARVTKLGLPEIQLGLLPAWGGSTRLPRLIGLPKALDIILAGKTLAAKPALKRGLVDEIAPVEYLLKVATSMLRNGKRHASHAEILRAGLRRVIAPFLRLHLRSTVLKRTRGQYPAVLKALDVVTRGISRTVPESLDLERDGILDLVQTEACRNLIRVFFLQERARKLTVSGSRSQAETKPIQHTAVIGAGVMGAGIAQWLSARDLPVVLKDINAEQVAKGMGTISKLYRDGVKRHVFTPVDARQGMDQVFPASGDVPLRRVDLVIEAAVEKLELKKQLFRRLEELAGEDTILATNTSALPIAEISAATRRPERVLGLHFFNPVHRMQLVEVVSTAQTSPEVLRRSLRFVQQIGKMPVLVKDSPGFLVNRILMPYLVEAGNLFDAGALISDLDVAMLDFGMPMGPMALLDEVGIDVAMHVAETLAAHYRERMHLPPVLGKMVQAGLLGRKTGRGFYEHRKDKKPRVNPGVNALRVRDTNGSDNSRMPIPVLQERMVLLMINEAARCLEEGVVAEPADVDFAMIMGTGFAPFRGGPLRHADRLGIPALVSAMERFVAAGATHFAPCSLLKSMASHPNGFYPK